LAKVEELEEQNYNMVDNVLNNGYGEKERREEIRMKAATYQELYWYRNLRHFKRHFSMNLIYCKYYRKKKHYYVLNKKHFLHNWKKIVGGVPSGLMENELM